MAEPLAALVVSAGDAEALRASLGALSTPATRTWCAVATSEEAAAAGGLAKVLQLNPWPGSRGALARLQAAAAPELGDDAVLLLGAGTIPQRNFISEAMGHIRSGAAIVIAGDRSTPTDGWGLLGRLTSSALAHAVLAPTSGLVMRADVLASLTEAGWLEGREIRLAEIRQLAGRVRVLRGGVTRYRSTGPEPFGPGRRLTVTVVVPAHNEEAWIGETLRSIWTQTLQPDEVIVVDDCSSDRTAEIAAHQGATVLRTPVNRFKAGAQNYALEQVRTDAVVTLDADTILHPEAIEHLMADLEAGFDATNGAVLPQSQRGIWTRARMIEYAMSIRLHKRAQRQLGTILVLSGCVAAFHTQVLRELGGFQERTITEDMDMTWSLHLGGYSVGYAPKAMCYPAEPGSWQLYKSQVRRWAAGLFQTIGVHGTALRRKRGLVLILAAALWDIVTSAFLLAATVVLLVTKGLHFSLPLLLVTGVLTVVVPIVLAGSVIGYKTAVVSFPSHFVGSLVNQYFYLEAMVREWVLRRGVKVWIKGH
ncbi:MAG TPA: glycosyltransferase [Acidimicrobiales bacterium]|nr:glycosyltransferase [Acidimicrobiales bacterium]